MRASVFAAVLLLAAATPLIAQAQQRPDPVTEHREMRARAEAGEAEAMWELGMMLLNGHGAPKDEAAAYRWVRAAGEAGFENGMISTAVMLALGQGTPKDPAQAREWYRKAAERHGSAHALRGLGGMLLTGEGGPTDLTRGLAYLELAQEGGDQPAAQILARAGSQLAAQVDRKAVDAIKSDWVAQNGRPN